MREGVFAVVASDDDAFDDAAFFSGGHQLELALGVLRLLGLRAPFHSAAVDLPATGADDSNRSLLAWAPSVLLANTAPEVAELTPASEGPVRETMLFDIRR